MGRSGQAWSLVSKQDIGALEKIANTWNLEIPYVDAPQLPEGMERDPVRKREDWDEVTDPFGMVSVSLEIGSANVTKRSLADWIVSESLIPALEQIIKISGQSQREFVGVALKPSIVEL